MSEAARATDKAGHGPAHAPAAFRAAVGLLNRTWSAGTLVIVPPAGEELRLSGERPGPEAKLVIRDYAAFRRILSQGSIGFAEGFMAGEWDTPDISALLHAFALNMDAISRALNGNPLSRWAVKLFHLFNANTRSGSKRNISAHYDLGNAFYSLWLDPSMTYSSAIYDGARDLEAAQRNKYAALAKAMDLHSGESVLEIGCGWGGFAEFAAREVGARVTGITISREQLAFARERMARQGLNEKVELKFIDYRDVAGQYDRIASIEMFEAVGESYWPAYFGQVQKLLKPGGRAGLQIITIREDIFETYRARPDFIQRYIFPGGMLPSESRLEQEITRAGMNVAGANRFPIDYADTLREWRDRFEKVRREVAAQGFDERFMRMWRYYLAYCEAGFRTGRIGVGQWVAAKA